MNVLLAIVVIVLVFAAIFWLLSKVTMEAPVRNIVNAVLVVIGVLLLLGILFGKVPLVRLDW